MLERGLKAKKKNILRECDQNCDDVQTKYDDQSFAQVWPDTERMYDGSVPEQNTES